MKRPQGFTLIELLVTLALMTLVLTTTVSLLVGGFRVWERSATQEIPEQELQLAFEEIRQDLHNAIRFHPIPFEGTYDALSFPALISVNLTDGSSLFEVGREGLFLDARHKSLNRSRHAYRWLRRYSLKDEGHALIFGVERLRFSYYAQDPASGEYEWKDSWEAREPPAAVRIEVGFEDASKRVVSKNFIVEMPTAAR